jgi:hypothetical protein
MKTLLSTMKAEAAMEANLIQSSQENVLMTHRRLSKVRGWLLKHKA